MSFNVVRYQFQDGQEYVTDQGTEVQFNPLFRAPSDFTEATIDEILDCLNLELRTENRPCPEKGSTEPRRLTFLRKNGNSFSLLVNNRANIITYAQCVWNILKNTDFPAVCVKLDGEKSLNLYPELVAAGKGAPTFAPVISPPEAAGFNAYVYSSTMQEYKSDATYGGNILMPFRSQTDTLDAPYSELTDYFDDCVNPVTTVNCAAKENRTYRRYIPSFLTQTQPLKDGNGDDIPGTEVEKIQTVTVPVKAHIAADIKTCGETLAAIQSVICLGYEGESNDKIHKLLTP